MFIKKIFILSGNFNFRIFFLLLLFEIKAIYAINSPKKISIYRDEFLSLDNENPMKVYYYQNNKFQQEKNYDIILQFKNILKVDGDIYIYVYASDTYIYNMDSLIKKNETTNEFMNYQKKFQLNSTNENYTEYSLTQIDFDENINITFYQYYYILFVKGNNNNNFQSIFLLFNTLDIIESYPNDFSNQIYYRYENNYNINNYIFKIDTKSGFNKNLNIQFLSYYENTLFNIEIYKKINGNDTHIYSLKNFNILDHGIPINDTQILYINLSFIQKHEKGSRKDPFSILFEISNSFNYLNIQKVPEKSTGFTFMAKKEIYFYFVIKNNTSSNGLYNQDYFYILQFLSKDEISFLNDYNYYNYFILEYFIAKEKEYFDENNINNNEINDLIINKKQNFTRLNSIYDQDKSLYFYKVDINNKNNKDIDNKLLIIKMYLNDNNNENKLKIKSINFRYLPLILLKEQIYNYKNSYIEYYKSNNYIDKIGYYYIPIRNLKSNKILYCPYENTMALYFGELDISKNLILPSLENQKIYIINPNNSTLFNGITILTVNKNSNYFLQYGDIDESILNNIYINNYRTNENMNKEIKINDNIKELYYFNMYYFNDSFIIDVSVIFGNVSIEYLSLDSLSDYDKNLYNIFPFNKQNINKYIKAINKPILIETSNIEIIRIINNKYSNKNDSSNYHNKSLFYINKYKVYYEVEENELIPLFISSGDVFSKFKINTNLLNAEIKYKFFINDRNPLNEDSKEYNISLSLNDETFYLSGNGGNSFHTGNVSLARYNQIKVTNICNKNILFWVQLGSFFENDYEIFYASQRPYNGMIQTSKIYLFVFDYINILNKKDIGLYPYKFVFNFEKPNSSKCNGYYRQSLVNKNFDALNYIFTPTSINSIYYDITTSENIISIDDDLNLEELDYILNRDRNLYLNTIIRQINGYLRVNFYMEYKYDLTDKKNELSSFYFDDSIYSIRYKLAEANKKYLLFQVLSCNYYKDFNVLFFKENSNISYSLFKNSDNNKIGNISQENIYGYINIENLNEDKDSMFLGVVRPGKLFIRYTYTNSKIDINFINSLYEESKFQYNINIEKIRKVENKDIFSISFEPFLKNAITNYFILTLNEKEKDIINECQFLSYLYNYKNKNRIFSIEPNPNKNGNIFINTLNYKKYISFKDEGISDRISRELTFETFGNYKIYILAEELESYSLYKLLGVKTYSYVNDGNGNEIIEEEDENEVSWILIMLIILLSLLIIILSAFIIYHYKRKENINQIIKFMNLPKNDSANLGKNNLLLSINKNENLDNSNNNLIFPILNNSEYKEDNLQENNDVKNENINKDNNEENNIEIDEEKSEPPPPAITAFPNENNISEMLEEIKHKDSDKKIDEENMYTNAGTDLTDRGFNKEE